MAGARHTAEIPETADPAVKFILREIQNGGPPVAWWRVEAGAGVGRHTVRMWHYGRNVQGPRIVTVRKVLEELGQGQYELAVVRRKRDGTVEVVA